MQFVRSEDLKPGMRLAKPIYNKVGVLLYERDTKLTLQSINSINNFGIIGIFILEPAEPVPPLSKEDIEFEQFQTIYMFQLKDCMDKLQKGEDIQSIRELVQNIYTHYGTLDHKLNFTQNLRSSADFVYKHSISVAILSAMIANEVHIKPEDSRSLIAASLLYDFGYLSVPQKILEKDEDLSAADQDLINIKLKNGYDTIRPHMEELGLSNTSLEIIQHMIFSNQSSVTPKTPKPRAQILIDILKVADKFDVMTAMNIHHTPMSELAAITSLFSNVTQYNKAIITALAESIHILPTGACLDFANGEKGLVLAENPADFLHPMILSFKDNRLYDLSDPEVAKKMQIVDIMKTMDNRIAIDRDALKHFVADPNIQKTASRFRSQKEKIAKKNHAKIGYDISAAASITNSVAAVVEAAKKYAPVETDPPKKSLSDKAAVSQADSNTSADEKESVSAQPAPKKRPAKRKRLV